MSRQPDQNPPPLQLRFVFVALLFLLGFSCYMNYEPVFDDLMNQLKLLIIMSPVLLLLAVHCLSSEGVMSLMGSPEQESLHRAGGSPWAIGFLLLFLVFMVSYQTSIHDRWFPLISRR